MLHGTRDPPYVGLPVSDPHSKLAIVKKAHEERKAKWSTQLISRFDWRSLPLATDGRLFSRAGFKQINPFDVVHSFHSKTSVEVLCLYYFIWDSWLQPVACLKFFYTRRNRLQKCISQYNFAFVWMSVCLKPALELKPHSLSVPDLRKRNIGSRLSKKNDKKYSLWYYTNIPLSMR